MPTTHVRSYSCYTRDAMILLGKMIRCERKKQKMTEQALAERAGISRGLLQRIEKGGLKCEIGVVFEVATLLGIKLFNAEQGTLKQHLKQADDMLTLLPQSIRQSEKDFDDDF